MLSRHLRRRASTLIYMMFAIPALMSLSMLAVDLGRVKLAKTQLQSAADAAARHAVARLSAGVQAAEDSAVLTAGLNSADNSAVTLIPGQDIEFGTWNASSTPSFTALSGAARASANAIRITARRTTARSNAVPLAFGILIGRPTSRRSRSARPPSRVRRASWGLTRWT